MENTFNMFSQVFGLIGNYLDENGDPVEKTKMTHPYSYDPYVVWQSDNLKKANDTIYSDRLLQWDSSKHDELCQKYFGNRGQLWGDRPPKKIEAFLRDWTENKELELVRVMEYCNQATGYPLWRFDFINVKEK